MATMLDETSRRQGIGGSEVGAILGVDDYRTPFDVWLRKRGLLKPGPPNIRMLVGKYLEEGVLKLYTHVTGRQIEYCGGEVTQTHPDRPWMKYTVDAIVKGERRGVDAKVVFWDQRRKWGETSNDIPYSVQLQAWWYMHCLEFDVFDIAALVGEGEPRVYTIERDREAERVMIDRVEAWYIRHVLGGEPPEITASADAARWLAQSFPDHKRPAMREATGAEVALFDEYTNVRISQRDFAKRRDDLETKLKAAIADKEGLSFPTGRFTWRKTKDGESTDWQGLALALLTYYVKDEHAREQLMTDYTRIKPGYRRIWFDSDLYKESAAEAA
jgi:predicted phage-related endonuclease